MVSSLPSSSLDSKHTLLRPQQFSGLVCVETNDLLGGGIGLKFQAATEALQKEYYFGNGKSCRTLQRNTEAEL